MVRRAGVEDAPAVGRLMHAFNTEFGEFVPDAEAAGARIAEHIRNDDALVLLADDGSPVGLAILRFRPALLTRGLDAYLEELYVQPDRRGEGIGRELLESAMASARVAGAIRMDLGTEEDDTAARALYESFGFNNTAGRPGGPVSFFYEREL